MKIALLNDTHVGVKNGSDIFLNDAKRFFKDIFLPYCDDHGIKDIIHLGDFFDNRKQINVKALNWVYDFLLHELKRRDMEMHIIPGNHCVYYKNKNGLNSLTHLKSFNNIHVYMNPEIITLGELDIAMLPWICDENIDESLEFVKKAKAPILCSHLELDGFKMMGGVSLKSHGMDRKLFSRFEKVLTGHFHTKSSQDNIHYLGTQVQLTWADANDPKYFHVLDSETRKLEAIRNPHEIFHTFHYDDSDGFEFPSDLNSVQDCFVRVVVVKKSDPYKFDSFIDTINANDPHDLKISDNYDHFSGDSVDDESIELENTTSLIDSYIDLIETELDKDEMKRKMHELYRDAQSMNVI